MKSEYKIPFILAWKHLLRSNKWTLLLIIFFMSIAFINMIFVPSLFNGIIDGFNKQIIDTSIGNIFIVPASGQDTIANSNNVISQIDSTPGVTGASAQMQVNGTLQYDGKKGNWSISAINPDNEKKVTNVSQKMIAGSYLDGSDEDKIILGSDIIGSDADSETADPFSLQGAKVGDTISLSFNNISYTFTIKGVFKTKFNDTDSQAFITQTALKRLNPLYTDEATKITIKIQEPDQEDPIIAALKNKNILGSIYTWRQASSLMTSVSDSFLSINVILSIFGILIAAITVFIVIYIDISTRRQEIGILRAIGIKSYLIHVTYMILSAVYSVAGVLLGTGLFFAIIVPYFNVHPFVLPIADAKLVVSPADFIARMETLIWVAIIAGLIPAIVITRTKLLQAIWGSK